MTWWQRIKAFFGFYEPPAPPAAVTAESVNPWYNADAYAKMATPRPEKQLYTKRQAQGSSNFGNKPPIKVSAPKKKEKPKEDDSSALSAALTGGAIGYAVGSHSHSSSSDYSSPSPTPSSSDFGSFSGGGGDSGGGGASGGFGD